MPQGNGGGAIPAAQLLPGLFGQDMFQSGASGFPAGQMLPQLMFAMFQQQLAFMMFGQMLAEMLAAGQNQQSPGQDRGNLTQQNWGASNRRQTGAWNSSQPGATTSNSNPRSVEATPDMIARIPNYHQLAPSMQRAALDAVSMGLRVTSTTGGRHTATSNHYQHNQADGLGHAIDVAGDPSKMAAFYRRYAGSNPRELYYDPMGGIKRGNQIGAIGGHGDHVHLALA